ncbi:hypothetical protein CISIN_1g031489mg [Citrus sinensis]|uniref:Uncharacterized protein n=1 Tax=Citrus sinensis TaxID=2711 RepID=A0A067F8J8_CITSI|nr:hypothetical protein CISIN_1g031489mg [Citrus sinensis]
MGKSSAKAESSTKSDRKFEKKLQFYSKVRDTVASLTAKKAITKKKKLRGRQKKLKVYNLSTLSESLPELKAPRQPIPAADLKLNCKARQKLMCVVQGYITLSNFLMPYYFCASLLYLSIMT